MFTPMLTLMESQARGSSHTYMTLIMMVFKYIFVIGHMKRLLLIPLVNGY